MPDSPFIFALITVVVIVSILAVVWIRKQEHLQREAQKLMPPPGQKPTEEDVIRLVKAGHKIAAIKLYRELHGTGLADSKTAVEALAAGNSPSRISNEPVLPDSGPANDEVVRLARSGNMIAAIKRYREIHQTGLADAKAAVETMMARDD